MMSALRPTTPKTTANMCAGRFANIRIRDVSCTTPSVGNGTSVDSASLGVTTFCEVTSFTIPPSPACVSSFIRVTQYVINYV